LLFIDLDDFKAVNDQHGHAAGDLLLQALGCRLLNAVRPDDRVCRKSGGEFLCLLPSIRNEVQALAVARKLVDAVSAPCQLHDVTVQVQVQASVGIAIYPEDGHTVQHLMDRADRPMYWAKAERLGMGLGLASRVPTLFRPGLSATVN